MTLILSGTDGLSDVDGSAATPAIRGTDTNTGIFFPAADTIAFSEGGVESMRIDSAGNMGLGVTPSAWGSAYSQKAIQVGTVGSVSSLTASSSNQQVTVGNNCYFDGTNWKYITSDTATRYLQYQATHVWYKAASGTAGNAITFTSAMTLDSSGNLLVGTTSSTDSSGKGVKIRNDSLAGVVTCTADSSTGVSNYHYYNVNATNNGYRFYVNINGGIANFSANNTNLSDERTKTNIQNAGSYLAKICAIPVRTFKYKDQDDDLLSLGVIAQEVETIAPELVDVSGFGEMPEDGVPLKAIYQTDLQYALMKSIQELKALVDTQASTITQLQADVEALKAQP